MTDYAFLIPSSLAFLGMAGALIGVWIKANEKILLARQANSYTQKQVDKLELRITELENNLFKKLDAIQIDIQEIKIGMARNERN